VYVILHVLPWNKSKVVILGKRGRLEIGPPRPIHLPDMFYEGDTFTLLLQFGGRGEGMVTVMFFCVNEQFAKYCIFPAVFFII
jgi:hypothetical protein